MRSRTRFHLAALVGTMVTGVLVGCRDEGAAESTTPDTIELSDLPATLAPPSDTAETTVEVTTTTVATTSAPTVPPTTAGSTSFVDTIGSTVGDDGSFRPESSRFTTVTDDTGRVTVRVPTVWTDRATSPGSLEDGSEAPYVAAAPDLTGFLDGYETAGLAIVVLPPTSDPAAALADFGFADDCTGGRSRQMAVEDLAGRYSVWTDCGGTSTDIVTLAVMPDDEAYTVVALVQILTDFDVLALDEALSNLVVRDRPAGERQVPDTTDPDD